MTTVAMTVAADFCMAVALSNFYSPLNGRSTYINTKTI